MAPSTGAVALVVVPIAGALAMAAALRHGRRAKDSPAAPPGPRRPAGVLRLLRYTDWAERLQLAAGLACSMGYSWCTAGLAGSLERLLSHGPPSPGVGSSTVDFLRDACVAELFNLGYLLCIKTVAHRLGCRLRRDSFRALIRRDVAFFDVTQTGSVLGTMAEASGRAVEFPETLARLLHHSVFVARGLAVLARLRAAGGGGSGRMGRLAMELFGIIAGSIAFVMLTRPLNSAQAARLEARKAAANGFAGERLAAVRTVQAFNMEEAEAARYGEELRAVLRQEGYRGAVHAAQQVVLHAVGYVGAARILFTCSALVAEGRLTVGGLVAFSVRTLLLVVGARGLLDVSRKLGETAVATAPLFDFLDNEPPAAPPARLRRLLDVKGALEWRDVTFRYPGRADCPVLDRLSLSVPAGAKVALVGSSGCGKTTLALLALKLYRPSRGHVLLDGVDIASLDTAWLRSQIGYVPQDAVLFHGTVLENIRYGADADLDQVKAAAAQASAHAFISALPQGYHTVVGPAGATLSGGQRQRVAIARALVRRPRLLLLDEATSSLDADNEAQVQAAIDAIVADNARRAAPMTVVTVGHRPASLAIADAVVVVGNGRILESGPLAKLADRSDSTLAGLLRRPSRPAPGALPPSA